MKDLISTVSALAANLTERERQLLRAALAPAPEPIAIVGIGCRFPGGADDPETFWNLLASGTDAVGEVPADRWNLDEWFDPDPEAPGRMSTRHGAFLKNVDQFDPGFFEISPHEARRMDPQQRLLLEVAVEALADAGIPTDALRGAPAGVFIGACNHDYDTLQPTPADAHTLTGGLMSVLSGRLSYTLGLQGPSLTLDTACSSSLVALHLACASLRAGECDLALTGGVNLILSPESHVRLSRMRALAPDGRCRTFDARASGYVRGEGVGVLVLKRLADATRDRDRVWALVRGSAVNHDGRSSGLTAPNGLSQRDVITRALADARVPADAVDYVEAHGTGTPLGDPIEVESLRDLFSAARTAPCLLGSVKTNIGHLEAAAGVAGVIKVALALHHAQIPRHLHFQRLNPRIDLGPALAVASEPHDWPRGPRERLAGVSSFGISGTNAHVVLGEPPPVPEDMSQPTTPQITTPVPEDSSQQPVHVLPLSAHTPAALAELAHAWAHHLRTTDTPLAALVHTAATRRSHLAHRLAVTGATHEALARALETHVLPAAPPTGHSLAEQYVRGLPISWTKVHPEPRPPVALPRYPWQHERYWAEPPPAPTTTAPITTTAASPPPTTGHPLLGDAIELASLPGLTVWRSLLDPATTPWLAEHRLADIAVLPATAILDAALTACRRLARPLALTSIAFERLLELPGPTELQLIVHPDARFELLARPLAGTWQRHAAGALTLPTPDRPRLDLARLRASLTQIDLEIIDARIHATGLDHGPLFKNLTSVWARDRQALANLQLPAALEPSEHTVHPALLDGCLQALAAADPDAIGLPVGLAHIELTRPLPRNLSCHVVIRDADDADHILADLTLCDPTGEVLGHLEALRVLRLAAAAVETETPTPTKRFVSGRPELEQIITACAREVLGFDPGLRIPGGQDLRDLGLDSLLALDLAAAISRELELSLANSFALDYPTISAMTDALARTLALEDA